MTENAVRIDKWLWYARVVKTRTLAQKIIRSGKVRLNRDKIINPSKSLTPEDVLTITLERKILVLKVKACGVRRGPFSEAQLLYEDLSESQSDNSKNQEETGDTQAVKVPRPDKQERRKLLELKNRQYYR